MFTEDFEGRVLPFDKAAASAYAALFALRREKGRPIAPADLITAATALAHDVAIATRDAGGFADCGVSLINPWST